MHWLILVTYFLLANPWADPEGGGGGGQGSGPPPPEKSQNIGFLSNIGQDPMKNHKATKPAFNFWPLSARLQNTIYMAFRWLVDDGPLIVVFVWILPPPPHPPLKKIVMVGIPLTKLSGSVREICMVCPCMTCLMYLLDTRGFITGFQIRDGNFKINFLFFHPKHMLWVLKRTVSMRQFFLTPKTYD